MSTKIVWCLFTINQSNEMTRTLGLRVSWRRIGHEGKIFNGGKSKSKVFKLTKLECAKFRGSYAIVPSCLRGSEIFSRGYSMRPKCFLVGILWSWNFSSWMFCGPEISSRGYFVGPKLFLSSTGYWDCIFLN